MIADLLLVNILLMHRLDARTMFKVRKWERFQFLNDYEHSKVTKHILTQFFTNISHKHGP